MSPTATALLGQQIQTVFIILMENHNWSSIKNSPSAPYMNTVLLPMASYADQYYNPPALHPSEPNYLWLEAGTNFGILDDNPPAQNHQSTTLHLVTLLEAAGVSWKAYEEGISGTVCPLTNVGEYAAKHDPFVYFDDVTDTNNPNAPYCIAHVRPYSELAADLRANTVARYNFITPNLCNDMHDSCAPLNNRVQQGDTWLSAEVPTILGSQAYADNGALFITWDEAASGDGPIGMIVLSPLAKGGGYVNSIPYSHSSTLRTMEEIFGVGPLLGDAANATDLSDLFLEPSTSSTTVPTTSTTEPPTTTSTTTVPSTSSTTLPGCAAAGPNSCDDSNPCTEDRCDSAAGGCTHTPILGCCQVDADCDDGDPCTVDSCSPSALCQHEPFSVPRPTGRIDSDLAVDACRGQEVPAAMDRLLTQAIRLIGRAETARNPKRARRLVNKAVQKLKAYTTRIIKAGTMGRISPECAAGLSELIGKTLSSAECVLATRLR